MPNLPTVGSDESLTSDPSDANLLRTESCPEILSCEEGSESLVSRCEAVSMETDFRQQAILRETDWSIRDGLGMIHPHSFALCGSAISRERSSYDDGLICNPLFAAISIPGWTNVTTASRKMVAFYKIQITNKFGLKWAVSKRYSEFQRLHQVVNHARVCIVCFGLERQFP